MIEIRRATSQDAQSLSALNMHVQKIHADAYPQLFKQPASPSFAVPFMQRQLIDPYNVFYITSLDRVDVGYIFARIVERPENLLMYAWKYIYIEHISVIPQVQRRGVGQRLLEEISHFAKEKGIETIVSDIWGFNQQSQNFFKNHGFEVYNHKLWKTI
jgi:ribosomal protein S18 acetylase RimI-like enzyme